MVWLEKMPCIFGPPREFQTEMRKRGNLGQIYMELRWVTSLTLVFVLWHVLGSELPPYVPVARAGVYAARGLLQHVEEYLSPSLSGQNDLRDMHFL